MDDGTFFERSRLALGIGTQAELGEKLGVSKRTAQRYSDTGVPQHYLRDLARLVHPADAKLAAEIAGSMGHTLESLGVVLPPPPAPPPVVVVEAAPPRPPPPPPPPPPPDGIVDAVVCAAAEAMEMMPRDVRPGLLAAFKRAREIGVTVDMVERVLLASLPAPPPPAPTVQAATAKRAR
jgi:hypothetical protein